MSESKKVNRCISKFVFASYLNHNIRFPTPEEGGYDYFKFNLGMDIDDLGVICETHLLNFEEGDDPEMDVIMKTKDDWCSIFERTHDHECFWYIFNCNLDSEKYGKIYIYYEYQTITYVCNIDSFLNNFPMLFAKRSSKLIVNDGYESWAQYYDKVAVERVTESIIAAGR